MISWIDYLKNKNSKSLTSGTEIFCIIESMLIRTYTRRLVQRLKKRHLNVFTIQIIVGCSIFV